MAAIGAPIARKRRPPVKRSNQILSARIKRHLTLPQLAARCRQSVSELFAAVDGEITGPAGAQYAFKDNGAKILAVAHCDTVRTDRHFEIVRLTGETIVFSAALDDRLGVYTILDLLPRLGIAVDVLLTENEERGASTARDFVARKEYNWIVEFDRRGETTVTYQFDGIVKAVARYFKHDIGTYSDIAEMDSLGCAAFNVGVGYHNEHTGRCYLDLGQYVRQLARFIRFYKSEAHRRFPHEPSEWGYPAFDSFDERCPACGTYVQTYIYDGQTGRKICEECGESLPEFDESDCTCCGQPLVLAWTYGQAHCARCFEAITGRG